MLHVVKVIYEKIAPKLLKNKVILHRWRERDNRKRRETQLRSLKGSQEPIRVLFIISSLPMWKGQGVYELLLKDRRFDPKIIIVPFKRCNAEESLRYSNEIYSYLLEKGCQSYRLIDSNFNLQNFLNEFNPSIIFPSQPYYSIMGNQLDIEWNKDRIYCYIPYGMNINSNEVFYNSEFLNLCWKIFGANSLTFAISKSKMPNRAVNYKVVGEPDFDKFQNSKKDPWKKIKDGKSRKRIIWAPHFSITPNLVLHRASFLWLFEEMFKIAEDYKDRIQIAFKPHPNLYSVLCNLDGWGIEKTDEYYNKWTTSFNTQLEEGNFVELFNFSDAMIHDSASFTAEYLFVNKPVLFSTQDLDSIKDELNEFGLKCLDLHYIGQSVHEIRNFIDDVILKGNDELSIKRKEFYNKYLVPPNGKTVAENIYVDLCDSLGLKLNQ